MVLHGACGIRTYPCRAGSDGIVVVDVEDDGAPPPFRVTDHAKFTRE
jgi:hypothetical protein